MRAAGVRLEIFYDHFASGVPGSGVPDTEWTPAVAQRGWIALTTDVRLRYNRRERDTIMGAGLGIIVLVSGHTHLEKAEIFLRSRRRIVNFIRQNEPPFIARLYRDRIELWLDRNKWTP